VKRDDELAANFVNRGDTTQMPIDRKMPERTRGRASRKTKERYRERVRKYEE
jgi:hypothetical protein